MTPKVFSVHPGLSVQLAAQLMVDSKLHRLFVEKDGSVIGILSMTDVARLVGQRGFGAEESETEGSALERPSVVAVEKPREVFIESFNRCEAGGRLPHVFYERFIGSSEEIRERFAKTDFEAQRRKIMSTLKLAGDAVLGERGTLNALRVQAEHHNRHNLNVPPRLYDMWLDALMFAVEECDPGFDPTVNYSWRLLMSHVIRRMKNAY